MGERIAFALAGCVFGAGLYELAVEMALTWGGR